MVPRARSWITLFYKIKSFIDAVSYNQRKVMERHAAIFLINFIQAQFV